MKLFDKFIIYSSVLSIFSESLIFHYIIDWKLFYVLVFTNTLLLSIKKKLSIHKNMIYLLLFLTIHGCIMFLLFKNPIISLVNQILGIAICSIYFYNVLKIYGNNILIDRYKKIAFIHAVIAIPMFYLNINVFSAGRLNGVMLEPAHYAAIMLPAVYLFITEKRYIKVFILILTILLSKSAIGIVGIVFMLIIPLLKLKNFLKYALLVFLVLGCFFLYLKVNWNTKFNENNSSYLIIRLKETETSINAINTGKFEKYTNLSSYALLSNLFIAKTIFLSNPLGTGLGSYKHQYDKNYSKLSPPKYLVEQNLSKINRHDANSLLLRIIADLGVFGLVLLFFFMYFVFKLFAKDEKYKRQSSVFYLIVKLIREGHYFPPEFYFFLLIFLKNFDANSSYS